ncbi:hypothetical protein [Actinomadura sp. GTD37]|uniref:hypothetical protein n=1 Tax=Actinomadura sp. GTD37 TaxID=1778030 RepID=UPI0035BEC174
MDTYIVTAHRDGKFWMLEIDGPGLKRPGATQVRRLDQAEPMVRDWLATRFDLLDDASIKVVIEADLPSASSSILEEALLKRLDAMRAQRVAQAATAAAARELIRHDLTTREIGTLLGISHQRVSQMVNSPDYSDRGMVTRKFRKKTTAGRGRVDA